MCQGPITKTLPKLKSVVSLPTREVDIAVEAEVEEDGSTVFRLRVPDDLPSELHLKTWEEGK